MKTNTNAKKIKKTKTNKDNTKRPNKPIAAKVPRIPRPKGTTLIAQQKTPKHLQTHIIKEYVTNNFTINQKHYNIEELANHYNIPIKDIYRYIKEHQNLLASLLDSPQAINQQIQAITQTILNGNLEAKGLIAQQVSLLLRSQGDTYKPFISSEVTKGLKLMLDGNDSMAKTLQLLMGPQGNTTNILFQGPTANQGNEAQEGTEAFGTNEAMALLHEKGLTEKSLTEAHHKSLFLEHGLTDTPEVCANLMEGGEEPTLKIGGIPDTDFEDIGHDNRREAEYGIVDDDSI